MWVRLGDRAIRLPRPPAISPRALVRRARAWPGVVDVVVAPHDLAVYFDGPPAVDEARVRALELADEGPEDAAIEDAAARDHVLRVIYDGPDLEDVARVAGLGAASEVIELHAAATYVVDAMGFQPGFAYMTGLSARLQLPRRATPRARVPAGSVAIASMYTSIYPFDSPGGWHLLGRLAEPADAPPLFGPRGARLRLGDRVRFAP